MTFPTDRHPTPAYQVIKDHVEAQIDTGEFRDPVRRNEPDVILTEPGELDPIIAERSSDVPEPVQIRTPAVIHYPKLNQRVALLSGIPNQQVMVGFKIRAIVVQNLGTNTFLYCRELNMYLTSAVTPMATFNLPYAYESLSFEWHTALFNDAPAAPVAGEFAVIWLYDEWVMPATAASGGGGGTGVATAGTATQSNVAQNAASVSLLAANTLRKDAHFTNDTAANLFISFGSAASLTNYDVKIPAGGYFTLSPGAVYTGQLFGIWDAAGAGAARVTELTA